MTSHISPATRRLNPFLFPSDTDFRFFLLIVAVIGASLSAFNAMQVDFFTSDWVNITTDCINRSIQAYPDDLSLQLQFEKQCRDTYEMIQAGWVLGGIALLFFVACAIYWLIPAWLIWRKQLTKFTADDDPQIASNLTELYREAGLSRMPVFLFNSFNPGTGGLAFGRIGCRYVALNGGLLTQFYTDPARFRAVVRHELAHLKNADVDKTYFAVAVSLAFVLTALFPLGISLIDDVLFLGDGWYGIKVVWRAFVLTAFTYLALAAVLRTREVYADVRASTWDGATGALRELLAQPARRQRLSFGGFHPDPVQRLRAFDEPARLFHLTFWDAFAVGVASTIAFPDVNALFGLLLDSQFETLTPYGASFLFAPLMAGVLSLGAWRKVYVAKAQGVKPWGIGRLGIALGLGMILGLWLSLRSAIPGLAYDSLMDRTRPVVFHLLWGGLLLIVLLFFSKWLAAGASVWLETGVLRKTLRHKFTFCLVLATGILAVWTGFWYLFWIFGYDGITMIAHQVGGIFPILHQIIGSSSAFWILFALWVYPLVATYWHKNETVLEDAYLEKETASLNLKSLEPLRPGLAIILGAASALCVVVFMAVIRLILHFSVAEVARADPAWANGFRISQIALAIMFELGVAFVAASWARRLGWLHGLSSAFLAGCLITLGYVGLIELGDCWRIFALGPPGSCVDIFDPALIRLLGGFMANWGALLSLPIAAVISSVATWLRQ